MSVKDPLRNDKLGLAESRRNKNQPKDDFVLENIYGVSCASKDALAANPAHGNIAFPASSLLVFLDPRYSHQDFLENPSGRSIKAVNFSDDGKYVAFGESGYKPTIYVYNIIDRRYMSKFQDSNNSSVRAVEFHPRSIYLAVMCANDFTIGVFDLKGKRLTRVTFAVEPLGMTLPKVGSYLIVCGHRKISLFSLMDIDTNINQTNIVFDRRSVLLGHQSDYTFVDIESGYGSHNKKVYTVTSCGYLCDLNVGDILIDRASKVDRKCFCVKYSFGCIFVGCAKNTVKICSPLNLSVVSTIVDTDMFGKTQSQPSIWKFVADAVGIVVNKTTKILTCAYSDHHRHSWHVTFNNDSVACTPVIPVDADGNEIAWQPTSYEIQERVARILNRFSSNKSKKTSRDGSNDKSGSQADTQKAANSRLKPIIPTFYVNATRFTPNGKEIICGNADGEIKIFVAETGHLSQVIEAHTSAVTHIELLYDDQFQLIASGGRDRVIFILDAQKNYKLIQVLCDHSSAIVSISMAHYDGVLTLVSSAADGVILIRRAIKGKHIRFVIVGGLADIVGKPRIYAYASDCIITGGDDGSLRFFRTDPYVSVKPTKTIKGITKGRNYTKAVAIDPSGIFLVANSANGTLVFNVHTGKIIATITNIPGVSLISFTDDCQYIVTESNDGCRFLWRLPSKMSDVMRAKLGGSPRGTGAIRYDKILSCATITQEHSLGYMSTTGTLADDSQLGSEQDETPTGINRLHIEDTEGQAEDFSSDQNSPVDCDSFSTCSTCSRSYTDVIDFSHGKNNFQSSEKSGQINIGLSQEARRLLRDNEASITSSLEITSDKKTCSGSLSDNPKYKRTSLGGFCENHTTDVTSLTSPVLLNRRNQRQDEGIPFTTYCVEAKGVTGIPLKNADFPSDLANVSTSYNDRRYDLSFAGEKIDSPCLTHNISPLTEYISAGSRESAIHEDFLEEKCTQALFCDSKTNQTSDITSEMQDNIMMSQVMSVSESSDDNYQSDFDQKSNLELPLNSVIEWRNRTENDEERIGKDIKTSSPGHKAGTFILSNLMKRSSFDVEKTETTVISHELTNQTHELIGDVISPNQGEVTVEVNGLEHVPVVKEATKLDGNGKGDNISCHGDCLKDVNQSSGVLFGQENGTISDSSFMSNNNKEWSFRDNSWNNYSTICSEGEIKQQIKETPFEEKKEHCEVQLSKNRNFQETSRNNSKCLSHLTNSQETFFKYSSDLKNLDSSQDLLRIATISCPEHSFPLSKSNIESRLDDTNHSIDIENDNVSERITLPSNDVKNHESDFMGEKENDLESEKHKTDNKELGTRKTGYISNSPPKAVHKHQVFRSEPKENKIRYEICKSRQSYAIKKATFSLDKTEKPENTVKRSTTLPSRLKATPMSESFQIISLNKENLKSHPLCKEHSESTVESTAKEKVHNEDQHISTSTIKEYKHSFTSGCRSINVHELKDRFEHKHKSASSLKGEKKQNIQLKSTRTIKDQLNKSLRSRNTAMTKQDQSKQIQESKDESESTESWLESTESKYPCTTLTNGEDCSHSLNAEQSTEDVQTSKKAEFSPRLNKTLEKQDSTLIENYGKIDEEPPVCQGLIHPPPPPPSPQGEIIAGLGSVVDLFLNQDDYLRKLREVRRNFEMSIQALRDEKKNQQFNTTRPATDE